MKLRIRGNSIRLRLGRSEVQRLVTDGTIEESTAFGPTAGHRFVYTVQSTRGGSDVSASLGDRRIAVRVPTELICRWATTDQVGIGAVARPGEESELRILIEKDFECIDAPPRAESQEDAFPHPLLGGACPPAEGSDTRSE